MVRHCSPRSRIAKTPPSCFRACWLFRWGPRNHAPPTQGKASRIEVFNRGDRLRFSRNPDTRQAERFRSSPWSGLRTASATESKRPPDGDTEVTSRSWNGSACRFASVRRIVSCTWTPSGEQRRRPGIATRVVRSTSQPRLHSEAARPAPRLWRHSRDTLRGWSPP